MRLALEGLCVKRAALSADRVQIERMEEILYLADFHYSKGHMEQMAGLDDKFHGLLYEAGGSKVLEHALKDYHQYLCRARKTSLSNRERAQQSNREHWRILEAVRESKIARMVPLGLFHICFRSYSSIRAALGVMVAHFTATPYFLVALAESNVT